MLDKGVCATIEELERRERVSQAYMSRVLRLKLLAPDTSRRSSMAAALGVRLEDLLEGFPVEWEGQMADVSFSTVAREAI